MPIRSMLRRSAQFAGVTVSYLVCFVLAYSLLVPPAVVDSSSADQSSASSLTLVVVAGLNVAVIGWLMLRSRWSGWRLAAAMILVFYAVQTFIPQLEALIFPGYASHLPPGSLQGILLAGFAHALLFIPLAVLMLGKWRADRPAAVPAAPGLPPFRSWLWRLPLAIAAYLAVYLTFGYYIAWRNPVVSAYYGGSDPGTFWGQLLSIWRDSPWLFGAQAVRGVLWVLVALLVIWMLRGAPVETMLAIGLLFAVVMNAGLLLPNPYMPTEVRMIHLVETASSNLLFGTFVGWLFRRHPHHRMVITPDHAQRAGAV